MKNNNSPGGANFYGSEHATSSTELIVQFQKIVDNRLAKWILRRMVTPKKFDHVLAIFAGVEKPKGVSDHMDVKIIEAALKRGMKSFGIDTLEIVKNALKEPYIRKGVANTLRSIAKYGITRPQQFEAPLLVVWNFTKQCNLRCKHCYASATALKNKNELTLEQKLKAVDILDAAGVTMIAFSGGEPLVSPDFWTVAEYAARKGIYTTIATNGTLLTKANVERLAKIGIKYVEISLDSADPKIHDMFRGVPGAWERTVEGIKNVVAKGVFDTAIATTATKYNLHNIPEILNLAIELKLNKFIVFNFIPTGRGKDIINMDLSPAEREELLNYLYDRWSEKTGTDVFSTSPTYSRIGIERVTKGTGKTYSPTHFANLDTGIFGVEFAEFIGGCGAGRIYAALEDNGDLEPCVFLPIRVGNILKEDFLTLWQNSEVLKNLRDRELLTENCNTCPFRNACGGCRARAYGYYGNYLAPDIGCPLNKENYNEVLASFNVQKALVNNGK